MLGRLVVAVSLSMMIATGAAIASDYPVAGTAPDRRPENAPVVQKDVRAPTWEDRFFRGVAKPRPASLSWFADQGSWYTPFDSPGMTGPYDIRNWHVTRGQKR